MARNRVGPDRQAEGGEARRLAKLPDSSLAAAMGLWVETMRGRSLDLCLRHGGLAHGHDYVIAAEASA